MLKYHLGKKNLFCSTDYDPETVAKAGNQQLQNACLEDQHTNEREGVGEDGP